GGLDVLRSIVPKEQMPLSMAITLVVGLLLVRGA
ncbi:cytosine permease, partial [Pasteurella multocida subsp. multocida str. Anand1_goat]